MSRRMTTLGIFLLIAGFLTPVIGRAADDDRCRDVLVYAANNYFYQYSDEDKKAWVYSKKCHASTDSTGAGMDVLVEAVPIGFSFTDSNTTQWCKDNSRLDAYRLVAEQINRSVSVPSVQNWASCIEAKSNKLDTEVRHTSDQTIQLLLTNRTGTVEQLTDVFVHSKENAGLSCKPIPQSGTPKDLPLNREVLINCTRDPVDVLRNGTNFKVFPGGSVTAVTTLTSYLYSFPEQFVKDATPPTTPTTPPRHVLHLDGMHLGTKAYWAGGTASQLLPCAKLDAPAPNFELVSVSTREERVRGMNPRGICGTPPYCDSAGEWCSEVYYEKACFINREWHEWYRAQSAHDGIPYSADSVCGV